LVGLVDISWPVTYLEYGVSLSVKVDLKHPFDISKTIIVVVSVRSRVRVRPFMDMSMSVWASHYYFHFFYGQATSFSGFNNSRQAVYFRDFFCTFKSVG
jgi:hypothetical protein